MRTGGRALRRLLGALQVPLEVARSGSAAGDESDYDVGRVAVDVLPAPVVDGGRARVGVPGSDLDVAKRHPDVEGPTAVAGQERRGGG